MYCTHGGGYSTAHSVSAHSAASVRVRSHVGCALSPRRQVRAARSACVGVEGGKLLRRPEPVETRLAAVEQVEHAVGLMPGIVAEELGVLPLAQIVSADHARIVRPGSLRVVDRLLIDGADACTEAEEDDRALARREAG